MLSKKQFVRNILGNSCHLFTSQQTI